MTAAQHAIFEGTYSDLRFVKTRKVVQVVVEISSERADAFIKAFGIPNPANPSWMALARLNSPTQRSAEQWASMPPKAQMLARSSEPMFQKFMGVEGAANATKALHKKFGINSRFPLTNEQEHEWKKLDSDYFAEISRPGGIIEIGKGAR